MSRRSRRQSDTTVTLFPFLAVLICTMGSLIVLLVVVVQQAGQEIPQPATETELVSQELPPDVEQQRELEQLKEDLGWEAEMLAQSREETLRRLKEQQSELSRAEDQTRQIKAELDRLVAESENLDSLHQQQNLTAEQIEEEKAALQKQIDEAAWQLAEAQDATQRKRRQFALVPYEGPNGTQRRPIYIECLNDRVILQPEGVVLKSDDFLPPVDADNALASAIRAIREYYLNNGIVRTSTEPYPLIVVRPNGASAFAACRGALSGWDDEFGYELMPDEMELAYPPVDAQLRELLERTIEEARWRKQQSLVPDQSEMVLSVDRRTGGFVRNGGDSGDALSRGSGGAGAGSAGRGGVFDGVGAGAPNSSGASGGVASGGSGDANRGSVFQSAATGGSGTSDAGSGDSESGALGSGDFGSSTEEFAGGGRSIDLAGEDPQGVATRPGEDRNPRGPDKAAGNGDGDQPGGGQSFDALAGVGGNSQGGAANASAGEQAGGSGGQARGNSGGQMGGQAGGRGASGRAGADSMMRSIARSQGANWALPGGSDGAIAIQRPVNLRCDAGTLELLPEAGTDQAQVAIPCTSGTESAVRDMVSALWTRVDSWGIAGAGAYWKPVIEVFVTPAGESRYAEVVALLEDSGLIVIRR